MMCVVKVGMRGKRSCGGEWVRWVGEVRGHVKVGS